MVECEGQRVRAIISTSSDVTAVSPKLARAFGLVPGPYLEKVWGTMERRDICPEGSVSIHVSVEGESAQVPAMVMDMAGIDLCLGTDFLCKLKMRLRFGKVEISVAEGDGLPHAESLSGAVVWPKPRNCPTCMQHLPSARTRPVSLQEDHST